MIKMVLPPMLLRILSWEFKRCFTFQNTDSKYILVSHRNTRPIIFVKIARCIKRACKHGKSFWKPSHIYRKYIVKMSLFYFVTKLVCHPVWNIWTMNLIGLVDSTRSMHIMLPLLVRAIALNIKNLFLVLCPRFNFSMRWRFKLFKACRMMKTAWNFII